MGIQEDMLPLGKLCEDIYKLPTTGAIERFVQKIKEIIEKIKNEPISASEKTKIKNDICRVAADTASFVLRVRSMPEKAKMIMEKMQEEFNDDFEMRGIVANYKQIIDEQIELKNKEAEQRVKEHDKSKKAKKSKTILSVLTVLIIAFFVITSVTKPLPTKEEKAALAKAFSYDSRINEEVYLDIKNIIPVWGIYTESKNSFIHEDYDKFVCECLTSSGKTVWLSINYWEYRSHFDMGMSNNYYLAEETARELYYSPAKRIYGTVKKTDDVHENLSSDIGEEKMVEFDYVIE